MFVNTYALAQEKAGNAVKQDSTVHNHHILLDSLVVTPEKKISQILKRNRKSLTHGNAAHQVAAETDLSTTIPGITADLERDLPGRVTFYFANGLPILTKQSQNHSLTPTMAYAVINPVVSEPNAKKSGPDAVVTLIPTYESTRNMIVDPLHQRASFATGDQKLFSLALVGEHSSPGILEDYIEELSAYAKTYSGHLSARFKTARSTIEVTGQHQYSENEFGAMFDVHLFRENDQVSTGFASASHKLGVLLIETGFGHQRGNSKTEIDEFYIEDYNTVQELFSNSYKLSLQVKNTSLSAFYHDVHRSFSDSTSYIQMYN